MRATENPVFSIRAERLLSNISFKLCTEVLQLGATLGQLRRYDESLRFLQNI
jgi:hypothetical protein